ncbi:MAG TPA: molybdopterin-synthase adenylyltransferase MoeB [Candidatus Polarisedimenticolaceae bacterium]|nr:molybdopterin-synthase adenylyltransferase MoeB [Candidatus Polarisedimenticolaceae bacterium]
MPREVDRGLALDPREIARYSRHLTLPEVGMEGQLRLRAASVLVVGAGGLGSPAALYLAAAGVGRLGLVEFDRVDLSNLQRQILYGTDDVGRPKLEHAARRLAEVNPHVRIDRHELRLDATNALEILRGYDLVLDGTDNFPTRYLVNDACVMLGKPNVYGSIFRFEGQVSVFSTAGGPCYRCLYAEPPAPGEVPNCAEGGVLGVLPGIIGTLQATEAIKLILGRGEPLVGRLLLFNALEMRFRELRLRRDAGCPVCGEHPTIRELATNAAGCATGDGDGASIPEIDSPTLERRLAGERPPLLLDVRTREEWEICRIDGAFLIPLDELPRRLAELEPSREIVVYCHLGGRSARAVEWLRGRGYRGAVNLEGGIDGWSIGVDPRVPRY